MASAHRALVTAMLDNSAAAIQASHALTDEIAAVAGRIADAYEAGHKLLVCGNGGSAADAQHFAGELMGRFLTSRSERAPRAAIALSADGAVMTCIANDYEYADVFARQVRGLAQPGDVLVGISTSGTSANVVRAFEAAPTGVVKVALCGRGGVDGDIADLADLALRVPFDGTAAIQAAHIAIIHAVCLVLEERFKESPDGRPSHSSETIAAAAADQR
jgi:D-sedoheptulose 7-phosphate isomerase